MAMTREEMLTHLSEDGTELNLSDLGLTDEELRAMAPWLAEAGVTTLYVGRNQLTSLEGCPAGVTTLDVWGNQLTRAEITAFRAAHPDVTVYG